MKNACPQNVTTIHILMLYPITLRCDNPSHFNVNICHIPADIIFIAKKQNLPKFKNIIILLCI